jgi:mRNA interferase RelE/StbE
MPQLVVHRRAARCLERMDAKIKAQLVAKLARLASNPNAMSGVKPMAGEWAGFHRMRHGDLRVIYMHDRSLKDFPRGFSKV